LFAQRACDEAQALPVGARSLISSSFAGWRVLHTADLFEDDQRLWDESYREQCPGLIAGHFDSLEQISYAVALIRRDPHVLHQTLVVFTGTATGYKTTVLVKPKSVGGFSVLTKFPPGKYSGTDGAKVSSRYDVICLTKLEAAAVSFFWDGKSFRSLVTSE
jgi:hypothetical protein